MKNEVNRALAAKKRSNSVSGLTVVLTTVLLAACQPRVATSFWRIGAPADSTREGYAVLHEGKKVRHCYPITEWTDTMPNYVGKNDTYHSLHHHGVAVESELMAYRIYFDKKQTIDPYCKRKPQLELAKSYWYPNDSLLAEGYGDDILRVSGTVGVGSVKYWNGKKHVHIEPVKERSERIVSQKKDQATIEVSVKGWEIPTAKRSYSDSGRVTDMTVRYTLKAGHRDMRCDVLVSEPVEGLCTGVQTIPAKGPNDQSQITNYQLENGVLLASFGTDWPVNDSAKYAKETVGLAVFIPHPYAGEIVQDKQNLLCLLKSVSPKDGLSVKRSVSDNGLSGEAGREATCHFYLTCCGASKENHPAATTAEEWFEYLRKWAKGLK